MSLDEVLGLAPVIPVLTVADVDHAAPLARALVAGGLRALEVTLRTPAALEVIRRMGEVEGAVVGAGTVLNAHDIESARGAGARFVVSPGLTEQLAASATRGGTPLLPGVATAGEGMRGLELGLNRFKFFPAETSGGAAAVNAFVGPFAHVRFCPTGGIRPETAQSYLSLPNVACVGGTWVAPPDALAAGDWDRIEALARAAAGLRA